MHPRPIEPFQQRRQLRRRQPHYAVADRRPLERRSLQPLPEQNQPAAVPDQEFHAVASLASEHVNRSRKRVLPQHRLDDRRETVGAAAEIDRLRRHQNPPAARSSECLQRPQHVCQQPSIDPGQYPNPHAHRLDLDRPRPGRGLIRDHHRHEVEGRRPRRRRFVRRRTQRLAPGVQLVGMQSVPPCNRTRHRIRSQALGDDPRLLLPAPPPPPLRPRQNLDPATALPINWQITWTTIHTRLPTRRLHHPEAAARDNVGTAHRLQTNGVAERFIRTLKEQIVFGRIYQDIEEVRPAVSAYFDRYNQHWLLENNGYRTPAETRRNWMAASVTTHEAA